MTEQRPEDNEQALTDSGVWVDESSSGLTHEPGVWVDRPAIDPDRLGAMIREQDGVTEHVGDVQEPNVGGGVPQPGSADQIHSLDLSSAYEEVSPKNPIFDPTVTEQVGLTGAEEHALQEAGFASGGAQIDAVLAEIAAVLQLVSNTSASIDEQKAAVQEKIDGLKSGLSTDTVVQPALEDLTPQQWDVIGAIITTHLQPESEPAEAGPSPDLTSSAYEEVSRGDSVIDSVYGQIPETLEDANKLVNNEIQDSLSERNKQETLASSVEKKLAESQTNKKDGLDLSSAYQEATPINPVFDSVYGQVQETKSSKANEEALEGANKTGNFEIQRLMDNSNEAETNAASVKEKAQDVIANSIEKSKNANEPAVKDGLDLSSAYQEATPINPVFDSVYGQVQETKSSKANEEAVQAAKQ